MTRFVQVSWGLQYTEVFLKIDTIKAYMQSFQKGVEVDSTTKLSESIASSAQDRMEEEIHQHIRISDKLAKEELFDYLTGWIAYFEYCLNDTNWIEKIIDQYNEKRQNEYKIIVELAEKKFKETTQYKTLNHLDFYEVNFWFGYRSEVMDVAMGRKRIGNEIRLEQFRKFFEAPDPDLIDILFIPDYLEFIKPIVSRCVNIAKKRLSYLKGENELKQLPEFATKLLPQRVSNNQPNRLKVNLTVEQLTILFRLLKDCKLIIITSRHEKDIHSFISENFETIGLEGKKSSPKNIGRLWSSKEPDVLNYWISKFKELSDIAEKK